MKTMPPLPSITKPQVISLLVLVAFMSLHLRNKIFLRKQNKTKQPNKPSPRQKTHTGIFFAAKLREKSGDPFPQQWKKSCY